MKANELIKVILYLIITVSCLIDMDSISRAFIVVILLSISLGVDFGYSN